MKRFHLFAGEQYYPRAGLDDYKGSFTTLKELHERREILSYDWCSIVQTMPDGSLQEIASSLVPA